MESNQDKSFNSQNIVNQNEIFIHSDNIQKRKYLYPYGHRMTPQMRWFKGIRYRCLRNDLAA